MPFRERVMSPPQHHYCLPHNKIERITRELNPSHQIDSLACYRNTCDPNTPELRRTENNRSLWRGQNMQK